MSANQKPRINFNRLPPHLREQLTAQPRVTSRSIATSTALQPNNIYEGDALQLLPRIKPGSIALSIWSPPYFVGKQYESHLTFDEWQSLLRTAVQLHFNIIKPGGFLVINIADILCFRDPSMPKIQADNVSRRRSQVSTEDVLDAIRQHPEMNRYQIASILGCSEQTVDRRVNGNNIRGGKYEAQTRVKIVGGIVEEWALSAGFYPYDRRIWVKDAAWENSRWTSLSYRAVDEFEYLYFFWKPGVTVIDRSRLTSKEWKEWGYKAIWSFPSVRANDDHEAKFPIELPRRAIRLLTAPGEVVLDCFLGSGTTAMAATMERRRFIGVEKETKYATLARANLALQGTKVELKYSGTVDDCRERFQ